MAKFLVCLIVLLMTSAFSVAQAVPPNSGLGITGGGGKFGTKYPGYVQQIRKKVSDSWLKPELDPTLTSRRVYITFDIARDGHPLNVRVERSSGVPLLDMSAVRALQQIDTFGPLPPDWVGDKISVQFWFDCKKRAG